MQHSPHHSDEQTPPPLKTEAANATSTPVEYLVDTDDKRYFRLPLIGNQAINSQIKWLSIVLGFIFLVLSLLIVVDSLKFGNNAVKTQTLGNVAMHSQRLAKASFGALRADPVSLQQFADSHKQINLGLKQLSQNTETPNSALAAAMTTWQPTHTAAESVLKGDVVLPTPDASFNNIDTVANELQFALKKLTTIKTSIEHNNAKDVATINELTLLGERIANNTKHMTFNHQEGLDLKQISNTISEDKLNFKKITTDFLAKQSVETPQSNTFKEALLSVEQAFTRLQQVMETHAFHAVKTTSNTVTPQFFSKESERIKTALERVQTVLDKELQLHNRLFLAILATAMCAMLVAGLMVWISVIDREKSAALNLKENQKRTFLAEQAKEQAHLEKTRANEINQKNQHSILRLMNELQEIGQGNLTVQATVSEDITGAIADSINLTVEELRNLIERINLTAEGVAAATGKTRQITTMLLELNEQHSQHIQNTGDRVLSMAHNITEVCNRADGSSSVAQKALSASYTGQQAVQASLEGMNDIRDQIQETAKRIKRLGESSQQISEIVAMISDITEQTNVLALNASIQAASAGEAGRGFTVVAEEVQRLAERSGESTKQIAALVRAIQTDTQDAVSAMEKSTQGVVEGTKLADAAGVAITDISKVSQELANIMLEISHTTRGQANQAQLVSGAIKQMLSLTERTTQGTRDTSQSTDELSTLAQALKTSVARFKVSPSIE
jgi:twitching motility protein PilJ